MGRSAGPLTPSAVVPEPDGLGSFPGLQFLSSHGLYVIGAGEWVQIQLSSAKNPLRGRNPTWLWRVQVLGEGCCVHAGPGRRCTVFASEQIKCTCLWEESSELPSDLQATMASRIVRTTHKVL